MEEWRNQLLHIYLHTRVPAPIELKPEPDEKIQYTFNPITCKWNVLIWLLKWPGSEQWSKSARVRVQAAVDYRHNLPNQSVTKRHVTQQSKALDVTLISRIGKRLKLCNLGDLNFNLVCVLLSRPPHWLFHLRHSMWFRLNIYFDLITQKNIHPNRRDNRSIINGEMNSLLYI